MDNTVMILFTILPFLLLAIPSVFARAGFGRRGTWFGASAACLGTLLVVYLRNCNWGQGSSGRGFDPIGDADYYATMVRELSGLGALAFAVAGCFYKLRPKEPGILGK